MRVAYTFEQCWHRVPGGTGVAALRIAEALRERPDVELVGVAGAHLRAPRQEWRPPVPVKHLPVGGGWMYEAWLRLNWPKVEWAAGRIDIAHATSLIPCATDAPLVVTLHDLAFVHTPRFFTKHGVRVFRRSVRHIKERADLVLCSSQATLDDCLQADIPADRLRLVPLGVETARATADEVARVRAAYDLPAEYLLFVGTVEPRKNLKGLIAALAHLPAAPLLVVAGAAGWGDAGGDEHPGVRFLGFVPGDDLAPLYAAAKVFCYPSTQEGYGLPVLEAMAQGTPVVTSQGSATEEVAGGAAVLVDPHDPADIARGIDDAERRATQLSPRGLLHAQRNSWATTAELTVAAYRELL